MISFEGLDLPRQLTQVLTWHPDRHEWGTPQGATRTLDKWKRVMHELEYDDDRNFRTFFYVDPTDPCGPCWARGPSGIKKYKDLDTARVAVMLKA